MLYIHVIFVGKENERVEFELNGLSDRKGICFVSKKKVSAASEMFLHGLIVLLRLES